MCAPVAFTGSASVIAGEKQAIPHLPIPRPTVHLLSLLPLMLHLLVHPQLSVL